MKTVKLTSIIVFVLLLSSQLQAQLKVTTTGVIGIATNTPNPNSILGVKLDVFGSQLISGSNGKLYFGDNNRYIGVPATTSDFSIVSNNSNWLRIGASGGIGFWGHSGADVTNNYTYQMFINQYGVGIGSNAQAWNGVVLYVNGNTSFTNPPLISDNLESKSEKKMNINNPIELVKKINGVNFEFNKDNNEFGKGSQMGFIGKELKNVLPELVREEKDGSFAIDYISVIPLLVEAIKEQQKIIDDQNKRIEVLEKNGNSSGNSDINNSTFVAKLYQNNPNPFSQNTEIKCIIPNEAKNADLFIYDMQGNQIKKIALNNKGEVSTIIKGSELKAGMYMYTLVVDGKEIDSKRMILTN